ncbi:MAG: hypothetical protein DWQ18_05825 [Crenarchaeota archaeon]|nr:MAG: hypothetical protein DWQ17_07310 [Thermoproteota archaeon]RDJ33559.1 MAG: hypothetical protein DWQ18_05825 [Thermoproteota archaeon]RDJ38119.1 MAG: hypothetical protein DWQ19_01350 [Thermoproteota archaeon]RDJ39112.1 MAG: hypothetical protein DWQ13_02320 [Thermoproteota archaeon]
MLSFNYRNTTAESMQKSGIFLVIVGGIVVLGIVLSFYGSQMITEGFTQNTAKVGSGSSLDVESFLDPAIEDTGVYVVQVMNFQENAVSVNLFDPFGAIIDSSNIEKESYEKQFEIQTQGNYRLSVENSGSETEIIIAIGHLPSSDKLVIGYTGFYILIVGLIGIIIMGLVVIKNKCKKRIS